MGDTAHNRLRMIFSVHSWSFSFILLNEMKLFILVHTAQKNKARVGQNPISLLLAAEYQFRF